MKQTVTIYQFGDALQGEINIQPRLVLRLASYLLRGLGAGLIGFAVIAAVFAYGPIVKEELAFKFGNKQIKEAPVSGFGLLLDVVEAQRVDRVRAEAASYGVGSYFSVVIPKIGAASDVIANVSTVSADEYLQALQKGVAHAKGTHFPGQRESIFLFSHSTDSPINFAAYNAVFYLLGKLEVGDRVLIFFADAKYEYEVVDKQITDADDTSWLEDKGQELLILQTCYPPGTSWKRQIVVAKPIDSLPR
ncbi:hypothetical protein A3F62_05135 [Candidatus Woesebacteria bacterium RIFCSPHIGHO2_12_FULL_44_11]|uniref:Sortase n=1 Tax=Candidatus Woesebacteria bacterium RIFCSPLOWO2_01_FULL_44_14 TaxID=1802525 RepID=A0A1F8C028_9BACT|nr:MAG: hypothetical protein A3F62_05135 [Candidatus Woesebacteria bacterium RIFCSPHIGHO2_12_FULL_44_11]OGM69490.1 MAG: hypothetical protein A2975_02950 [Candidatus Woesebacteria bacterium RIFCSPLOWO2_01_FULL_44_14]